LIKKILDNIVTLRFKQFIYLVPILLSLYILMRTGFLIVNYRFFQSFSARDIVSFFMHGLRFDLAAIFMSNGIIFLLLNLPFFKFNRILFTPLCVLMLLVNSVLIFINVADFGYFAATHRRISYEPFAISGDIFSYLPSLMGTHYILSIISLVLIFLFCFLGWKYIKQTKSRLTDTENLASRLISLVLIILLSVIFIRGGFQLKPIRPADAFISDNSTAGYLVLNSTFCVILSAVQDDINDYEFMPGDKAAEITREMFADRNEKYVNSDYIFLRKNKPDGQPKRLNVVIFIMEGWSALYCGSITGKKTYTPFFDSLASNGLLYTNFFASGQRSIEAVPSILVSVPSVFNSSIISSDAEINRFRGIGSVLKEFGYHSAFHHGARTGSMGFDGFTKIAGFNRYYGMEDFDDSTGLSYDGVWGIYDEPYFIKTCETINGFREPFCSVIFSLSSHDPFKIPEDRVELLSEFKDEPDAEKSIRYSDYSLRKFFEAASKEQWFGNTVFLITADHTFYSSRLDFYTQFHVPMLIYFPANIKPRLINKVSSHADILPTIIDLLNLNIMHSSMGISLLSPKNERYCFEKLGSDYCIINDSLVLMNDFAKPYRLYNYLNDPGTKKNIVNELGDISADLNKKLQAFLQTSSYALKHDRIYIDGKY